MTFLNQLILIHGPLLENAKMRRISELLINELFLKKMRKCGEFELLIN